MHLIKAVILAFAGFFASVQADTAIGWTDASKLPSGFHLSLFSDQTPNARSLALGDDGTVYVGTMTEGKVYALPDRDHDGRADRVHVVAAGLNMPNGVAYLNGNLYVAEIQRIVKLRGIGAGAILLFVFPQLALWLPRALMR